MGLGSTTTSRRMFPYERQMIFELGWTTLPGLRGVGCSEFRAKPAANPDLARGEAIEFVSDAERDAFLRQIEEHFAARRFTNTGDAFDAVKAYMIEHPPGR